jgi:integrase
VLAKLVCICEASKVIVDGAVYGAVSWAHKAEGQLTKARVVLIARLNIEGFPFVNVEFKRNAIQFPIVYGGKFHESDAVQGFYVRYPHTVGNCLFPGCKGGVARHVQPLGKDRVDAYAQFQRIERDFTRVREGKLPVEEVKPPANGRIEEAAQKFASVIENKSLKARSIESYLKSLEHFQAFCASANVRTIDQISRDTILNFVGWMKRNLETRAGGSAQNTYRNKLKDVRVFLNEVGVGMPLKPKDWPKEVKARKEKYSTGSVKNMLAAADTYRRHDNCSWTPKDDKDLVHFLLKTGWRDDEIAHAQYSDINWRNSTVNVTSKPKGTFPGHPEIEWKPKNSSAREKDIVVDDALLKRLKARKQRYSAKQTDLIFPSKVGSPNNHLIRVIQRLAKEAGVEGKIGLHKFRKTFATMVAREEGIEQARILLGHDDVETTQRYLAADEAALEQDKAIVKKRFRDFGD